MDPIERMIELQQEFEDLYLNHGLVGMLKDSIQIDLKLLKEKAVNIEVKKFNGAIHYTAYLDGIKFTACEVLE